MRSLIQMFGLIKDQHRRLASAVFINTLLGLGTLANPYFFKLIVDALTKVSEQPGTTLRSIMNALLILVAVRVLVAILGYFQEAVSDLSRINIIIGLRRRLYLHSLSLSIDYYERHKAGEIMQKLNQAVYEFGNWLQVLSEDMMVRILGLLFAVVAIWLKNPWAGLIITIAIPITIWLSLQKIRSTATIRGKAVGLFELSIGHITESIQNISTVRTLGGESYFYREYKGITDKLKQTRLGQYRIEWRYNLWTQLLEALATVGVVGVVAIGATQGRYTPGDILLVAVFVQQITASLRPIARFIGTSGEVISTSESLLRLLAEKPTVTDKDNASELVDIQKVEFKNVGFSYPGHRAAILRNVSFELGRGQILALVGPSGTGKTTLVKLLLRFYEPTTGSILINGQDITSFTAESVRRHMGVVMQDVALFNTTFEENLQLAKDNATTEEIDSAVKLAHAVDILAKLPEGYKTLVGERGIRLSGGQKQRLAIARAILKNPDLVILDEATSSLDSVSESKVQAGLSTLINDRMAVVIAHRLSTIMHADQILVIEHGRVEEQGSHAELIESGGLYAKLYEMQSNRLTV